MPVKYIGMNPTAEHLRYVSKANPQKGFYQVRVVVPDETIRAAIAGLTGKPCPAELTKSTGIKGPPPPKDKNGKPIWRADVMRAALPIVADLNNLVEAGKRLIDPAGLATWLIGRSEPTNRQSQSDVDQLSAMLGIQYGGIAIDEGRAETVRASIRAHYDRQDAHIGEVERIVAAIRDKTMGADLSRLRAALGIDTAGMRAADASVMPKMIDVTPDHKRVTLDEALDTWETHRYDIKKKKVRETQKRTARRDKARIFGKLFEWGDERGKSDPTDMASYTNDEMTAYLFHLAKQGGSIAFDHWTHIASLFGIAKKYKLISVDPTEGIDQPVRVQNSEPPFTPAEQWRILMAAVSSEKPATKFGNLLSKYTGANNSEIFEAQADEFYYMTHPTHGQVLVWDTRLEGRERDISISDATRNRALKTGADRGRLTPIHPAVLAEGFAEYLATRRGKALFEGSPNVHSTACNNLVHSPDDGGWIEKVFKSWRKSFTDPITRLSGRLLGNTMIGEYLSGHRPENIHGSFYIFHTEPEGLADLVTVVYALDDPIRPRPPAPSEAIAASQTPMAVAA